MSPLSLFFAVVIALLAIGLSQRMRRRDDRDLQLLGEQAHLRLVQVPFAAMSRRRRREAFAGEGSDAASAAAPRVVLLLAPDEHGYLGRGHARALLQAKLLQGFVPAVPFAWALVIDT